MKKTMKKMTVALLLALMAALVAAYAGAQDQRAEMAEAEAGPAAEEEVAVDICELTGVITEAAEDYLLMDTPELGKVQVWLNEDTLIEGVDALEVGQTAIVLYNGMMTRSLPPQINALRVGVYKVEGVVTQQAEGGVMIESENGEIWLNLPQDVRVPAVGEAITAYTTGMSTMSLPSQMSAVALAPVPAATPGEASQSIE